TAHLLVLAAGYGGLPLDYRTDPVGIDFTTPATVDALRQVLDLAKSGLLKYSPLSTLNGTTVVWPPDASIFTINLDIFGHGAGGSYKPVFFPRGTKFSAIPYDLSVAYISARSTYPEACYRWLNVVSHHPDLFTTMPVRRSLLQGHEVTLTRSADM